MASTRSSNADAVDSAPLAPRGKPSEVHNSTRHRPPLAPQGRPHCKEKGGRVPASQSRPVRPGGVSGCGSRPLTFNPALREPDWDPTSRTPPHPDFEAQSSVASDICTEIGTELDTVQEEEEIELDSSADADGLRLPVPPTADASSDCGKENVSARAPLDETLERLQKRVKDMLDAQHSPKSVEKSPAAEKAPAVEADASEVDELEDNDLGIGILESQRRSLERRLRASEQRRRELEAQNLQLQQQLHSNASIPMQSRTACAARSGGVGGLGSTGPRPRGATQAAQTPAVGAQRVGRLRSPALPPAAEKATHPSSVDPGAAALRSRQASPPARQASSPGRALRRTSPKSIATGSRIMPSTPGSSGSRASPERAAVGSVGCITPSVTSEACNDDEHSTSRGDAAWKFKADTGTADVEAPSKARVAPGRGLVWPSPSFTARVPLLPLDRATELAAAAHGSPSEASVGQSSRAGQQRAKGDEPPAAVARRRSPPRSTVAAPIRGVPSPVRHSPSSPPRHKSPSPGRRCDSEAIKRAVQDGIPASSFNAAADAGMRKVRSFAQLKSSSSSSSLPWNSMPPPSF